MKILIASPEAVPYVKTGGLADVVGTICKEFQKMKHDARVFIPFYRKIAESKTTLHDTGVTIKVPVGGEMYTGRIFSDQNTTYFIQCNEFFDRQELYGTPEGDFSDNASRFVFFSLGILEACRALNFKPDIIHCNDWQTALLPLYLKKFYKNIKFYKNTATLLTIHNLGYQGVFPASELPRTNLGWEFFTPEKIEFYGKVNFLKAGIIYADSLGTVSNTYAKEILRKEHGFGLDGVLRTREADLHGIINGIDYEEWNPSQDNFLPATYTSKDLSGKLLCKKELLRMFFGKTTVDQAEDIPVISLIGRLSEQKGIDIILKAIPDLLIYNVRLLILGKGDQRFQEDLVAMSKKYSDMVSVTIGLDETLAHRIYAGSDFFLMPSQYEPCGLGQLISQRYGTIPVARKTGGLAETIQDFNPFTSQGTGFLFTDYTPSAMVDSLKRAFCIYTEKNKMKKVIVQGMKTDFSWKKSAQTYAKLYRSIIKEL